MVLCCLALLHQLSAGGWASLRVTKMVFTIIRVVDLLKSSGFYRMISFCKFFLSLQNVIASIPIRPCVCNGNRRNGMLPMLAIGDERCYTPSAG